MYKGGGEGRSDGRQWEHEHEHGDSSRNITGSCNLLPRSNESFPRPAPRSRVLPSQSQ